MMNKIRLALLMILCLAISACNSTTTSDTKSSRGASHAIAPPSNPSNIALFLPLSGVTATQAKAIEAGFFNSYYQDKETNGKAPTITLVNTSNKNIAELYQQYAKNGTDLIVGPLLKEEVTQLNKTELSVPVLALNNVDVDQANRHIYQFGLSPQTEAQQLADRVIAANYRRVIIITSNDATAKRVDNAFQQRLKQQGGQVIDHVTIANSENISKDVKGILHFTGDVRDKNSRSGQSGSTNAARRHDFDAIFIAAPNSYAVQVVPTLQYYYAGDVPVFATSMVYNASASPELNKDLNGVIICDMPWIANPMAPEITKRQNRLYAFGEDAYLLTTNLNTLINGASVNGRTGQLSLQPDLHINRQLTCMRIIDGLPQPSV